jgi:hypothetical protein
MADIQSVRLSRIRVASLRGGLPSLINEMAERARNELQELEGEDSGEVGGPEDG